MIDNLLARKSAEQQFGTMPTASSDLHTGKNQYFNQYHFLNLLSIACFGLIGLLEVSMSFLGKTENNFKREKGLDGKTNLFRGFQSKAQITELFFLAQCILCS